MLSGLLITDVIASRIMEAGKIIRDERVKRGWSQAKLGEAVGVSQVAIKKIEDGATSKSKYLPKVAEVLGIPLIRLDSSLTQPADAPVNHSTKVKKPSSPTPLQIVPSEQLMGEIDLPVHSIAQGGRGALVLENEPFTYTARPQRLIGKRYGYGVLIIGDSMFPEYRENDTAFVDPNLHPRKDDACVFQGVREDGTVEALIKYLDRSPDASDTVYYVRQSNPSKRFTIKKVDWQKCHVLVGKESGR